MYQEYSRIFKNILAKNILANNNPVKNVKCYTTYTVDLLLVVKAFVKTARFFGYNETHSHTYILTYTYIYIREIVH